MGFFPEAIAAQMAGRDPRCLWLMLIDFVTEPSRILLDHGEIDASGHIWRGTGDLVAVSGLEQVVNGQAPEMTVTLSALNPAMMALARDEFEAEAMGREIIVYMQFQDETGLALDAPYPVARAVMRRPQFKIGEDGTREIIVSAESAYALRARPPYAMYTDADQQRRFAGDKGFSFVPTLRNKTTVWPDY